MKLNPTKCAFDVNAGTFLGFMVTQMGIEVNPANKGARFIDKMRPLDSCPIGVSADSCPAGAP
ncbi:hypothetical protein CK203_088913 [Vitis vinifera]|uniref:Uncharacterized protein n=1 Tax=Vitis vinifera TaxID=29760 RepID=A0A438D0N1_VITVI|nr:hypothetical protein CK203_088913 [Vitis vinifera]